MHLAGGHGRPADGKPRDDSDPGGNHLRRRRDASNPGSVGLLPLKAGVDLQQPLHHVAVSPVGHEIPRRAGQLPSRIRHLTAGGSRGPVRDQGGALGQQRHHNPRQ